MRIAKSLFLLALVAGSLLFAVGCRGSFEPLPTSSPPPQLSYLEQKAKDIGVEKSSNGHLSISGVSDIRFQRLLLYLNAEAKSKGGEGTFYPYKVAGLYKEVDIGALGYHDMVRYWIQFSSDSFGSSTDLQKSAIEQGIEVTGEQHLVVREGTAYEKTEKLLKYLNAEAANSGRGYKLKAKYNQKQNQNGELTSDRVDILIQFSFDSAFAAFQMEIRSIYPSGVLYQVTRQQEIIARAAVEFTGVLQKPEELTITTFDFIGDAPNGPEWAYVFDAKAIAALREIQAGKKDSDLREILAFPEVKKRAGQFVPGAEGKARSKEPIEGEAAKIVAEIAVETARLMDPSLSLDIIIYDFRGDAPAELTSWAYTFDREAIIRIQKETLTSEQVLKLAKVREYIGAIPGGRIIPPIKQLPAQNPSPLVS